MFEFLKKIAWVGIALLSTLFFSLLGPSKTEPGEYKVNVSASKGIDWRNKDKKFWKERLTPEQYRVCRRAGTEKPFSGKYNNFKSDGIFKCVVCDQELFDSKTKFDSGTGWPSFSDAIDGKVELADDSSFFRKRIEVKCSRCGSHLGHVFDDGPPPTGKRYCINSVCLDFEPRKSLQK